MKKLLSLLLVLICSIYPCISVFASTINGSVAYKDVITTYEDVTSTYEDGYFVIEITTDNINSTKPIFKATSATKSKTGTKKISYYTSSNKLLWTVNLTGTFSYNGSSATCTKTSCSITNLNSGWSVKSKTATKSKNKAIAKVTMHQNGGYDVTKELTLTCDKNGKLK